MDEVTIEDIIAWKKDSVTILFMENLELLKRGCNEGVHTSIKSKMFQEAADFQAGLTQIEEIIGLPDEMIEEIKEGESVE